MKTNKCFVSFRNPSPDVHNDFPDELACLDLAQGIKSKQTAHVIVGFIRELIIIIPA